MSSPGSEPGSGASDADQGQGFRHDGNQRRAGGNDDFAAGSEYGDGWGGYRDAGRDYRAPGGGRGVPDDQRTTRGNDRSALGDRRPGGNGYSPAGNGSGAAGGPRYLPDGNGYRPAGNGYRGASGSRPAGGHERLASGHERPAGNDPGWSDDWRRAGGSYLPAPGDYHADGAQPPGGGNRASGEYLPGGFDDRTPRGYRPPGADRPAGHGRQSRNDFGPAGAESRPAVGGSRTGSFGDDQRRQGNDLRATAEYPATEDRRPPAGTGRDSARESGAGSGTGGGDAGGGDSAATQRRRSGGRAPGAHRATKADGLIPGFGRSRAKPERGASRGHGGHPQDGSSQSGSGPGRESSSQPEGREASSRPEGPWPADVPSSGEAGLTAGGYGVSPEGELTEAELERSWYRQPSGSQADVPTRPRPVRKPRSSSRPGRPEASSRPEGPEASSRPKGPRPAAGLEGSLRRIRRARQAALARPTIQPPRASSAPAASWRSARSPPG